ncbi:class I SAM-dependent methyltransferase [Mesorhizobium sp. ASY16-5R]|uniref:class I SAM-dependent methyltransferase n=1 Tax=Mesorhizobium sp. ASY16-5R TaxID=3445772 RepID=UPI003F9EC562
MNSIAKANTFSASTVDQNDLYDREFHEWLKSNPGGVFSQYSVQDTVNKLNKGGKHHTLGGNLYGAEWSTGGISFFKRLRRLADIPRYARICDYGCGSLRIGIHFIKQQNSGCYYGLDVTRDFIEQGVEFAGDVVQNRCAKLGTIGNDLESAVKFDADLLFAANIVCHIHPEEAETFYANIKKIVHRPNGIILLHVVEHPFMVRYQKSGWAWPLDFYDKKMRPFRRVGTDFMKPFHKAGYFMNGYVLVYERPAKSVSILKNLIHLVKDKYREQKYHKKLRLQARNKD